MRRKCFLHVRIEYFYVLSIDRGLLSILLALNVAQMVIDTVVSPFLIPQSLFYNPFYAGSYAVSCHRDTGDFNVCPLFTTPSKRSL